MPMRIAETEGAAGLFESRSLVRIARYLTAMAGPVGSAFAQFILSLILLHEMAPHAYGIFSLMLILSQFSWGVWTALFCAPLPALLRDAAADKKTRVIQQLMAANLIGAAFAFVIFALIGRALAIDWPAALLFAGYAAMALLRWFARAHAYALGRQLAVTRSDLSYAAIMMFAPLLLKVEPADPLRMTAAALLIAATVGLLSFGPMFLRSQFITVRPARARGYIHVWRQHSGWSLLGVVTTESTANAHAYIVTLLQGPAAFAPIAASSLLIRPFTVAMNAMMEFERPRLALAVAAEGPATVQPAMRLFRLIMLLIWAGTAGAAVLLLYLAPGAVFGTRYSFDFLAASAALWMGVGLARLMRAPESAFLQAIGAFRQLAFASVVSGACSIVAVLVLLAIFGTLASLGGILIGETVFAVMIWRQTRRSLAELDYADLSPLGSARGEREVGKDSLLASEVEQLQCPR